MFALRRKPARAGIVSALTLLALCVAMFVLPAAGTAAPLEEGPAAETPTPQLSFEPEAYDFGLRQVYNSSETSLQLRNDGEAAAPVSSLDIVGPDAYAFWINGGATSCYARNLQPNETCSVQVGFNPNNAAQFAAQLRVSSEGGASFTANLSGEGGRSALGPAVDPTSFGEAAVGSAGVTKAIEITNSGNYPGGAFIAVIAGGAIGSFHLLDENCTGVQLSPAASCTLLVNFQPLSTGIKTARLGLFGDQDGGTQVTLTGVGIEAPSEPEVATLDESGVSSILQRPTRAKRHIRRHKSGHRLRAVSNLRVSR